MSSGVTIDGNGPAIAVLGSARAGTGTQRRTRWWVEALAIAWLLWVYDAISNLAPLRLNAAVGHALGIWHLEQTLHIDPELALDRWLTGHHTLGLLLSDYYDNAHFLVTLALLGWLWWSRADLYRPLRNSLLLVNALAFVVFWRYPVAPPRMLSSRGFTDVVASTHAFGSWHTGALASQANQLAAMPSLHMAWAAWCALVLWKLSQRPLVRGLALLYPCLTAVAVLATGNHFVLDILGGLMAMAVAVLIVRAATRARARAGARTGAHMWSRGRVHGHGKRPPARPAKRAQGFPTHPFPVKSGGLAYRLSQTCYEVQDQVD